MEPLTEDERQLLVVLVSREWVRIRDDPEFTEPANELFEILRKLMTVVDDAIFTLARSCPT